MTARTRPIVPVHLYRADRTDRADRPDRRARRHRAWSRTPPSRRAHVARAGAGALGRGGGDELLPRQEPRRRRGRGCGHDGRRRASPRSCASWRRTAARRSTSTRDRHELAARRHPGVGPERQAAPPRRLERRATGGGGAVRRTARRCRRGACAHERPGTRTSGTSMSSRSRTGTRSWPAWVGRYRCRLSTTRPRSTSPRPTHDLGHRRGEFPVTEAAAGRILSLPMFPHLTGEQQERVVGELCRALRT